jgi:hypothetical protein
MAKQKFTHFVPRPKNLENDLENIQRVLIKKRSCNIIKNIIDKEEDE